MAAAWCSPLFGVRWLHGLPSAVVMEPVSCSNSRLTILQMRDKPPSVKIRLPDEKSAIFANFG
jgi:hypothetical protein